MPVSAQARHISTYLDYAFTQAKNFASLALPHIKVSFTTGKHLRPFLFCQFNDQNVPMCFSWFPQKNAMMPSGSCVSTSKCLWPCLIRMLPCFQKGNCSVAASPRSLVHGLLCSVLNFCLGWFQSCRSSFRCDLPEGPSRKNK